MAVPERVKNKMKELGLSGVNKPKKTPGHKTKSHVVMAKEGDTYKVVRFGQQGVEGAGAVLGRRLKKPGVEAIMQGITRKASQQASYLLSIGAIKLNGFFFYLSCLLIISFNSVTCFLSSLVFSRCHILFV